MPHRSAATRCPSPVVPAPAGTLPAQPPASRRLAVLAGVAGVAGLTGALLGLVWPVAVRAQGVNRRFPADALRGEIEFGTPPQVELNDEAARLAPGARIRGQNNMLVLSGALVGRKGPVIYTLDSYQLLKDVWLLTEVEAKKRWPKTAAQAAQWRFDPIAQTWTEP